MSQIGEVIVYIMMIGVIVGAAASILRPSSALGQEFVAGIQAIGPVFLAQAGIMVSIPYLTKGITFLLEPLFQFLGSNSAIAALAIIATDVGGYQLADKLTTDREMWITAMVVGFTSGATIIYSIPVGFMLLKKINHKYMALGCMAGLISIPFSVISSMMLISFMNLPIRDSVSTTSEATVFLTIRFLPLILALLPLVLFCIILTLGLKFYPKIMVTGFLVFVRILDAVIKTTLALSIIEHFTGIFSKTIGWGFDPMFADEQELTRAIEIAGYIGIMLAGTFPMVYILQTYCGNALSKLGNLIKLSPNGSVGMLTVMANILATYYMFSKLNARDKVICVAFGVCAAFTFGDHLAFTTNFQPTLIIPIMAGKLIGGAIAVVLAIKFCVPEALRYEKEDASNLTVIK